MKAIFGITTKAGICSRYNNINNIVAWRIVTRPEAIGRFWDFVGCLRSASASNISFKTYVAEDARQNITKAIAEFWMDTRSLNAFAKKRGAMTKIFFTHCFGRINLTRSMITTSAPIAGNKRLSVKLFNNTFGHQTFTYQKICLEWNPYKGLYFSIRA